MPVEKNDLAVSLVRTITPLLVGLIVGVVGSDVAGITEEALTAAVATVVSAVYYVVVRLVEQKWPKVGVLLGWAQKPTYPPSS